MLINKLNIEIIFYILLCSLIEINTGLLKFLLTSQANQPVLSFYKLRNIFFINVGKIYFLGFEHKVQNGKLKLLRKLT